MNIYIKIIALSLIVIALAACTRVPVASNHLISPQKKAKSAHHWDVLADDVALQVFQAISSNSITTKKRLAVAPPTGESSFNRAFNNFLINGLVNRGLAITKDKNDTSFISFETQLIKHNSDRRAFVPGKFTLLSSGVWVLRNANLLTQVLVPAIAADVLISMHAGPQTHVELVVTTSMYDQNKYVFRRSDIYYIESEDVDLFREFIDLKVKSVEVTDR